MKLEEIKEILKSITYKPNHYFEVVLFPQVEDEYGERRNDACGIRLKATVDDSNVISNITLGPEEFFPHHPIYLRMIDREYIIDLAFQLVRRHENHEVEEWFKVDGTHWVDPHPGGGNQSRRNL